MFFEYRQNNSGGSFTDPAITVIVEADNVREANSIAENNGVYFNGIDSGNDCECCGDRWHEPWDDDGREAPSQYGEPLDLNEQAEKRSDWADGDLPSYLIIYKDGTKKTLK